MCKGIAVIVFEKNGELKGLCSGISSHDELCKQDEDLRYGTIEPYRFELLYPCNLIYDRGYNKPTEMGLLKEQPSEKIWNKAFEVSNLYRMKHNIKQLQYAYLKEATLEGATLEGANLEGANLRGANLRGANLEDANLRGATLEDANLRGANLRGANLKDANLRGANLEGANLKDANLRGATLEGANLKDANLKEQYYQ